MSNTDRFSMLERWAIGMEKLEQYYEGKYGPPATPAQLPAITTRDAMLEAIADAAESAKEKINKLSPVYHNTDSAYIKTVPNGAKLAIIEKIGGNTIAENNQLISAEVTSIVSKDNGTTIDTLTIPAEIQALEGYGWSAGTVYNYIDYERKKFVQNVGSVVLDGTQTNGYARFTTTSCRVAYAVSNVAPFNDQDAVDDKIISSYLPANSNNTTDAGTGTVDGAPGIHRRANGSSQILVSLGVASGITNLSDFNAYLGSHPLTVYYELATPAETDISSYLTDDSVKVKSDGTVTFENSSAISVPSTVLFEV